MTTKQVQRLEKKIADIKRTLAAEKRKFVGYDDSPGLRYLPTQYYFQVQRVEWPVERVLRSVNRSCYPGARQQ